MIDPETKNYIDQQISDVENYTTKKLGDTPTDALQLTPKKYVDGQISSVRSSFIPLGTGTAKADIIAYSAASVVGRLGIGANNTVLTADSSQTLGMRWASVLSSAVFIPAVAGEAITVTVPQAIAIEKNGTTAVVINSGGQNNKTSQHMDGSNVELASMFTMASGYNTVTKVTLGLAAVGSPVALMVADLFATDANGAPTGTAIATSNSVNTNTVPPGITNIDFTYASPVTLTEGTIYNIVLRYSSVTTINITNYINWNQDTTSWALGTGAELSVTSGVSWSQDGGARVFTVSGYFAGPAAGRAIRSGMNNNNRLQAIGFLNTSCSSGDSIQVQVAGLVTGFSGLGTALKYYFSDTTGGISSVAGTTKLKAGYSLASDRITIEIQETDANL